MAMQGYTQTPVLSEQGVIESVLSEHSILVCMATLHDKGDFVLEAMKVADISSYLDEIAGQNSNTMYHFIAANKSALEVKELYDKSLTLDRRLVCVFVTKTGNTNEKLEGLITPWDLSRISA